MILNRRTHRYDTGERFQYRNVIPGPGYWSGIHLSGVEYAKKQNRKTWRTDHLLVEALIVGAVALPLLAASLLLILHGPTLPCLWGLCG